MILVNAFEQVVDLLKKDGGVYLVSPTYSVNVNGLIEENPRPQFIPVAGILAIYNNTVMLNNSTRLIAHVRPNPDKYDKYADQHFVNAANFIIANIVAADDHVLVFSNGLESDQVTLSDYYSITNAPEDKKGTFYVPNSEFNVLHYYGICEYFNQCRSFAHRVSSLQALPVEYAQKVIGDSEINNERAKSSAVHPLTNAYLIHHTGFVQDAFSDEAFTKQMPMSMENDPTKTQYYAAQARFFDETWNWLGTNKEIEAREVPEETLQEYPVQYVELQPPVDMQQMGDTFAIPEQLTHPIKNESGEELVPAAVYKHGDGVVVEFRNSKTGDIVPVFCKE